MSTKTDNQDNDNKDRIAKVMAHAGLCSRRDAERWIAEARVEVNGQLVTTPATLVGPDDAIKVDGKLLNTDTETLLWRYYKPDGLVTSHKDPEGRPTVFDNLPPHLPRVVSVGRLDLTSEGLLLLTNDGALARYLEHPSTGWVRRYRVRAYGRVTQEQLDTLAQGVTVDGVRYGPIEAEIDRVTGGNVWLTIGLTEGKNREIRRVLASFDLTVNRLIRMSYGPFQLGRLKPGDVEQVARRVLFDQLGLKKGDDLGTFLTEQNQPTKRDHPPAPDAGSTSPMTDDETNNPSDEIVIKPRQAKKTLPRKEKVRHVKASSPYERRALRRNRREEAEDQDNPDRARPRRYRDHRDPPAKRRSDDSRRSDDTRRSEDGDRKPGFRGKRGDGDKPGFKGKSDFKGKRDFKDRRDGDDRRGGYKGKADGDKPGFKGKSSGGFKGKRADSDKPGGFKGKPRSGGGPKGPGKGPNRSGPGRSGPSRGGPSRGGPSRGGAGKGPNRGSRGK